MPKKIDKIFVRKSVDSPDREDEKPNKSQYPKGEPTDAKKSYDRHQGLRHDDPEDEDLDDEERDDREFDPEDEDGEDSDQRPRKKLSRKAELVKKLYQKGRGFEHDDEDTEEDPLENGEEKVGKPGEEGGDLEDEPTGEGEDVHFNPKMDPITNQSVA